MYYLTGEKQRAFEKIFQYFEKIDRYSNETFLFFDKEAWAAFLYRFTETLRDVLGWVVDSPETGIKAEQVYGLILRFKNRFYDMEMSWKNGEMAPKLAEYYRLLKIPVLSDDEKGQMEIHEKKRRLQEEISSYRPNSLELCMSLEELEGMLGEGEMILDYLIYNSSGEERREKYLVFCITGRGICFHNLGERRRIDEDMENFYYAVSFYQCGRDYLEQQLICVKEALGLLDMYSGMDNVRKLYLGLDGEWMPKMPWHYILSEYETQVCPSFAAFRRRGEMENVIPDFSRGIHFFANTTIAFVKGIDYSLAISAISKIFLKDLANGALQVYEGDNADRESFVSIHSPSLLHVAVHGYSGVDDDQSRSRSTFGGRFQSSVMLMSSKKSSKCTLRNLAEYEEVVTMLDVMQMDLAGTGLVVLNSCEMGIGNFRRDEGVYGFPRAFFIAGAESVLTCLWKVDAIFSVIFLDYFYRSYFTDGDMEKALAESRTGVRKMTAGDVRSWLERSRESIEAIENGKEIYAKMEELIGCYSIGSDEFVFSSPAYWACFTLVSKKTSGVRNHKKRGGT